MRKRLYGAGAVVLALGITGAAIAYYNAAASAGSGAAQAAALQQVDVTVDVEPQAGDPEAALYPGDLADVTITATAPAGWPATRRARVGSVDAAVDASGLPAGCEASWFVFDDSGIAGVPGFVTGSTPLEITGATIEFEDLEVDQSACADASLDIDVELNPGS